MTDDLIGPTAYMKGKELLEELHNKYDLCSAEGEMLVVGMLSAALGTIIGLNYPDTSQDRIDWIGKLIKINFDICIRLREQFKAQQEDQTPKI